MNPERFLSVTCSLSSRWSALCRKGGRVLYSGTDTFALNGTHGFVHEESIWIYLNPNSDVVVNVSTLSCGPSLFLPLVLKSISGVKQVFIVRFILVLELESWASVQTETERDESLFSPPPSIPDVIPVSRRPVEK